MNITLKLLIALLVCCSLKFSAEASISLFHTQDRTTLKNEIQQSIMQAEESILIFTFTLSESSTIQLLNEKAAAGVAVTVVIDKDHLLPITTQGSPFIKILTRRSGEGRIHHKAMVIDNELVYLGSANITDSAFLQQENMMICLSSRELAAFLHHEKEVFAGAIERTAAPPPVYTIDGQSVLLGLLPHDGFPAKKVEAAINKEAKKALLGTICEAKSSIYIAMMVWTDPELAQSVIEAKKRGVEVKVLTTDMGGVIPDLQRAGIEVAMNPHFRLMHNKFMYIDGQTLVNGSANWSKSSFTRNDESFVVLYQLTSDQQELLDSYWDYLWPIKNDS